MLYTKKTAAELLQNVLMMDLNDSIPAVSQICILTLVYQSILISLEQNSTPRVAVQPSLYQSLVNRLSRQLLPTPGGPIIIILNVFQSYFFILIQIILLTNDNLLSTTTNAPIIFIIFQIYLLEEQLLSNSYSISFEQYLNLTMNQDNNPNQQAGMVNCAELIEKLPFWTRVVYFSMAACWLLDLITGIPSALIASSIDNTFKSYEIWTIFTASFYVDSLFFLFLIIYNFNTFLPKLQQRISTSTLMLSFILNGAVIQLLTLLVQYLFSFQQGKSPLNGVQGIWFCMLYKYCYFNSESKIKFCCFNWKFKRAIYPYIMLGLCILFKFSIPISMVVGLLYGMFQVAVEKYTTRLSARLCYDKISSILEGTSIKCWIRYTGQLQTEGFSDRVGYQSLQNFVGGGLSQSQSPDNSLNKDPFANQKGIRIGDY